MSLADLPLRQEASIVWVHEPGEIGERLMEMGLTPGAFVQVLRRGAFGDPLQLRIRGYRLSLRRAEARTIEVASR